MMERFYGFDLGDAESAIARLMRDEAKEPEIVKVCGTKSFVTAYARQTGGKVLIGEEACYSAQAMMRKIRFKSCFLTDPSAGRDIQTFAAAVLSELYESSELAENEDCCFYIGCPAGWNKKDRERYREIFEKLSYPPLRIISESRAALISACQSRHLQLSYDIMHKPVLVVDVGSSTTDFAYIEEGHEKELKTAGEVALGGGLMDEQLLGLMLKKSADRALLEEIFEKNPAWRSYCEFAARRLKEKYFSDEEYWENEACVKTLSIIAEGKELRLRLEMDRKIAKQLQEGPVRSLGGRSFHEIFKNSLLQIRESMEERMPDLLFLTGGVSRLPAMREWCQEAFPEAIVVTGPEPEFSVARGLAYTGRIDEDMKDFRMEVAQLIESSLVEQIVSRHMDELYDAMVDALTEPMCEQLLMKIFDRWKSGEIRRLTEIDEELKSGLEEWINESGTQKLLSGVISGWLRSISYDLEEYTMPICLKHNIPYKALNLTGQIAPSDLEIKIDTRDIFGVDQFTWLINAIVSVLVGLICGGNGIALIAGGLQGILAGTILSMLVLFIGREQIEKKMMDINLPTALRKLIPRGQFESRIRKMTPEIKARFHKELKWDKNEEISERMAEEISGQIEQCLSRMAEVVEIPLG